MTGVIYLVGAVVVFIDGCSCAAVVSELAVAMQMIASVRLSLCHVAFCFST